MAQWQYVNRQTAANHGSLGTHSHVNLFTAISFISELWIIVSKSYNSNTPADVMIADQFSRSHWRTHSVYTRKRETQKKHEVVQNRAEIWCFGAAKSRGRGHPISDRIFINLGHHRTCGKVWWRSAKRPRRLDGEKKNKPVTKFGENPSTEYWRYRGNIKLPRESRTHGRTDGRTHGRTTRGGGGLKKI